MTDDLDLRGVDERHEPDPRFRAALRERLEAIVAGTDLSGGSDEQAATLVTVTPLAAQVAQERPSSRVARGVMAIVGAAAVAVSVTLVLSRQDAGAPADTPIPSVITTGPPPGVVDTTTPAVVATAAPAPPPDTTIPTVVTTAPQTSAVGTTDLVRSDLDPVLSGVLAQPSADEEAQASNVAVYQVGTGHSDVTPQRRFAVLRRCVGQTADVPCAGTEGWAYVTGAPDSTDVHYGLLPVTSYLVVSPLDDRLFVASGPAGSSEDPDTGPRAWLIDSVTGQRGSLTWNEAPATLHSPEQVLVLFPAHPQPYYDINPGGFLPRIVDRSDWSIRPLNAPADASAAVPIHQPGADRIWVGTAPEGGHVGLAYTDDGGATWERVELPSALRPTSAELHSRGPGDDELLSVAASGDHVAVTDFWGPFGSTPQTVFVTSDAGTDWRSVPLDQGKSENATEVFALPDGRLVVATGVDPYVQRLFVSTSASDWTQLDESPYEPDRHSHFDVNQQGLAVNYGSGNTTPEKFSTDLITWWTIPGFPSLTGG